MYPNSLFVHPLSLTASFHSFFKIDFSIHDADTVFPFKLIKGESTVPSTQIHSITVVYFCCPGCIIACDSSSLLTTTYILLITPIEKPVSSILYIFSVKISNLSMIDSHCSNHINIADFVISLPQAISIVCLFTTFN